jgi:hypothetical protein
MFACLSTAVGQKVMMDNMAAQPLQQQGKSHVMSKKAVHCLIMYTWSPAHCPGNCHHGQF